MKPKGIENAEATVEACRGALAALDSTENEDWSKTLESVVEALEGLQGKFFLKTNPAIPVTRDCRREAEELKSLAGKSGPAEISSAIDRLKTSMEKLLKAAKMEGVIIT